MIKLKKKKKVTKIETPQFKKRPPPVPPNAIADKVEIRIRPVVYYEIHIHHSAARDSKGPSWGAWHNKGFWTEPHTAREMAKLFAEQESKLHKGVEIIDHSPLVTLKRPPLPEYVSPPGSKTQAQADEEARVKENGKKEKEYRKKAPVEAPDMVKARDKMRKELGIKAPKPEPDPYLEGIANRGKKKKKGLSPKLVFPTTNDLMKARYRK
jgi:hypothetical protein